MDYINDWYKKDAYVTAYNVVIQPVTSPNKWSDPGLNPIEPPPKISLPGEPKKKKIKVKTNHLQNLVHLLLQNTLGRAKWIIAAGVAKLGIHESLDKI